MNPGKDEASSRREPVASRLLAIYLACLGTVLRHHRTALALIACLWVLAACLVPGLRFDMSFRPLFSSDAALNQATQEFERTFAQSSGAYVVAILESDAVLEDQFLTQLEQITRKTSDIHHVSEVISLAQFMVPRADEDGARIVDVPALLKLRTSIARRPGDLGKALAKLPEIRRVLLSDDGRKTLVLARLDIPLSDLASRRPVVEQFESVVSTLVPPGTAVQFSGVSVVEDAYARLVLRNMLISVALTVASLALVLLLFLGHYRSVLIALAGVAVATPMTLATMALLGQPMTIINSMVPTMVLIIGVADGIHMLQAYGEQQDQGLHGTHAVPGMVEHTALPCLMTSATTVLGFLSLRAADLPAVSEFGTSVAIGVFIVYVLNQLLVPLLCHAWPPPRRRGVAILDRICTAWMASASSIIGHWRWMLLVLAGVVLVAALQLPRLDMVQKFNEELATDHPVRMAQATLERDFGGFLGPELAIRRRDGASLLADVELGRISALQEQVRTLPGVLSIRGVPDFLAEGVGATDLLRWREDSPLSAQIQEVLSADGRGVALLVRVGDIGTRNARMLHERLLATAAQQLGGAYEIQIAGQWWLAQRGMMEVLDDMTASLLTAGALIIPLLLLVLRSLPLLVASLIPNMLPMLMALAYMAATGITLRIGTAMVLAGTIGIAFDDTVHFIMRLHRESRAGLSAPQAAQAAIRSTGRAVLLTTLVLLGGFLSMLTNELQAIRDMGQVAAIAFAAGFLADIYLAPAVYLSMTHLKRALSGR